MSDFKYKLIGHEYMGKQIIQIQRTDPDGKIWSFGEDEGSSFYAQYLADTKGGLPRPKDSKN